MSLILLTKIHKPKTKMKKPIKNIKKHSSPFLKMTLPPFAVKSKSFYNQVSIIIIKLKTNIHLINYFKYIVLGLSNISGSYVGCIKYSHAFKKT